MLKPTTPFDAHAEMVNRMGYHNHRVNTHSNIISDGILRDLWELCPALHSDLEEGRVGYWKNEKINWGRGRVTDVVVAEPSFQRTEKPRREPTFDWHGAASIKGAKPNLKKLRIVIEHKSVITAHRNRDARHDDLNNMWQEATSDVIVGATVMIGLAERYLNVADQLKKRAGEERFNAEIVPRLKAHDRTLFDDFAFAISNNKPDQSRKTFEKFSTLPIRPPDRSARGFDVLFLCPVYYDNVNPAYVARDNPFGINVDSNYQEFLKRICNDYTRLWGNKTQ